MQSLISSRRRFLQITSGLGATMAGLKAAAEG